MIRYVFAAVIFIHGLIHFMGFAKAYGYGNITQITRAVPKPQGMLWLLAAALLVAAAVLMSAKKEWVYIGLAAVVLSQVLICIHWHDARFGTIANAAMLLVIVATLGAARFAGTAKTEAQNLLSATATPDTALTEFAIGTLPPIVQQWIRTAGTIGKPMVLTTRLRQTGTMRTKENSNWMPFEATQYFTTAEPGFVWIANVNPGKLMSFSGRDSYRDGKGHMLIKVLGVLPIVDAVGPEINQGSLLRYLAEMAWMPPAAMSSYITWAERDATSAVATMSYKGITASAIFTFNAQGDVVRVDAKRYMGKGDEYTLEDWSVALAGHRNVGGYRIPQHGTVSWLLKTGTNTWLNWDITSIEYNTAELY